MPRIPHFILINPAPRPSYENPSPQPLCKAWNRAIYMLPEEIKSSFSVFEGTLDALPADQLRCDCIVSPANSFGIMDGGYDKALSWAFVGKDGHRTLTRCAQAAIQERWCGYAPASSCTITALPSEVSGEGKNAWAATTMAIVPTMRQPESMDWHKDVVYNSMWSLCVEIARWNRDIERGQPGQRIERVLMTGLATGYGKVSIEKCAKQMTLAVRHFVQGVPESVSWGTIDTRLQEVDATLNL